jgi:hypothetical protein
MREHGALSPARLFLAAIFYGAMSLFCDRASHYRRTDSPQGDTG